MKKNEIKINEFERKYSITNDKYTISVYVNDHNQISIYWHIYFHRSLDFIESYQEVVENVAKLMLEAVKLVKKKKIENK